MLATGWARHGTGARPCARPAIYVKGNVRDRMKQRRIAALWALLLMPLALLLGYVGFRSLPGADLSRVDALFASLQLFGLDAPRAVEGMPWTLNVARFLAPLSLVYATGVALVALLHEQVNGALIRLRARDHVVLVGLGGANSRLAESLRRRGHKVVAVEVDPTAGALPVARSDGVMTLIGDASQGMVLEQAQVVRARHIVISTGSDSQNLEVLGQLQPVLDGATDQQVVTHVSIDDEDLWTELGALQLGGRSGRAIEFFNLLDREARTLVSTSVEGGVPLESLTRLRLEGDGRVAMRVAVFLVRRAMLLGLRPEIHVSEQTRRLVVDPLVRREPWVGDEAKWVVNEIEGDQDRSPEVALVCISSAATAVATALAVARQPSTREVVVSMHRLATEGMLDHVRVDARVHLVSAGLTALDLDHFLHHSGCELMAEARHEDYLAQEFALRHTTADNPSLVPWSALPESLKASNRRFAQALGPLIHGLGGRIGPLRGPVPTESFLTGPQLEELARSEHDRWSADLERDGWVYDAGAKDAVRKTHPLLIPWDQLPEPEREKDRDAMRAVPRMLARVGYRLTRD